MLNVLPREAKVSKKVLEWFCKKFKKDESCQFMYKIISGNLSEQLLPMTPFEELYKYVSGKELVFTTGRKKDVYFHKIINSFEFLCFAGVLEKNDEGRFDVQVADANLKIKSMEVYYFPTPLGFEELKAFYCKSRFWLIVLPVLISGVSLFFSAVALFKN